MATIISLNGNTPIIPESCFLAPSATIVGEVSMNEECSIWFNAVIRGDVNSIEIGKRVNVQDNVVIHCTYKKFSTVIGDNVSIGHNAIVHGCDIHDNVLVGMGSIIMDGCIVESNSIVAAGAVVTAGTQIPSGYIYGGIPAKKIKKISPDLSKNEVQRIAENYILYSSWYNDKLTEENGKNK
jgi:carbonic anhydrase/acetyltransferase-like protein (isoleucine patch superfamily)|tara:strand:+ start:630 stop:1175 length:546 start_codon:yes stop_codon:yes gene_type:complete